ncbi:MAG: hypothetical protein ACTSU6_01495, partial [Candidatus Njordarchaeales archaeon]
PYAAGKTASYAALHGKSPFKWQFIFWVNGYFKVGQYVLRNMLALRVKLIETRFIKISLKFIVYQFLLILRELIIFLFIFLRVTYFVGLTPSMY